MKGAVYSSLPIPRFTHALLNESEAALFSFSKSPVVPTSCLEIQVFFLRVPDTHGTVQGISNHHMASLPAIYAKDFIQDCLVYPCILIITEARFLFSPILPTLQFRFSSACKLLYLQFHSHSTSPPFKTQWTGCGKHLHWYTGYKSPASLLSAF